MFLLGAALMGGTAGALIGSISDRLAVLEQQAAPTRDLLARKRVREVCHPTTAPWRHVSAPVKDRPFGPLESDDPAPPAGLVTEPWPDPPIIDADAWTTEMPAHQTNAVASDGWLRRLVEPWWPGQTEGPDYAR